MNKGAGWLTTNLDTASANYNFNLNGYHNEHPSQLIIESESCSCTTDINSHFGVNDISGFPKDDYYYYKSAWFNISDEIILYILPNTWNGDTNTNPIQVHIYSNCEYVELFINNKSQSNGQKQKIEYLEYYSVKVNYEPGVISCNCYDSNNNILKTSIIETTNKAYAIKLQQEYPYNNESIIGENHNVLPNNDNPSKTDQYNKLYHLLVALQEEFCIITL